MNIRQGHNEFSSCWLILNKNLFVNKIQLVISVYKLKTIKNLYKASVNKFLETFQVVETINWRDIINKPSSKLGAF